MAMGGNYVRNRYEDQGGTEPYTAVYAGSAGSNDTSIPSGASIVRGIYYMWDDGGFTGKGWMYNVAGSPTNIYSEFNSDADVADYVAEHGNLDAVFAYWAQHYTLDGWDNFYNAVGVHSGCMDVDHSAS